MPFPSVVDIIPQHLFTRKEELDGLFPKALVARLLRLRDMYQWLIANPDGKDREFVDEELARYDVSKVLAYDDLRVIKSVVPHLTEATRDFHRWKYNEMILQTYRMAKARKDTKTMERAATSYARHNNVGREEAEPLPYDQIVVQPFTATSDPTVLGLRPIPHLEQRIEELIDKYRGESHDIDDIEYEPADLPPQPHDTDTPDMGRGALL